MRKKILSILLATMVVSFAATGCGSSQSAAENSSSATSSQQSDTSASVDENTVYGKVTKADGNNITYEVLTKDENSQPPQKPDGDATTSNDSDSDNSTEKKNPSGEEPPQMSEGEKPKDGDRKMMGYTSTGESSSVEIADSISVQSVDIPGSTSDISVSEIAEGDVVQITYDGDAIAKVLVQQFSKIEGKMRDKKEDNTNVTAENTSNNKESE